MAHVCIKKYTTGFSVETTELSLLAALESYNRRLTGTKFVRSRGALTQADGDSFYLYSKLSNVYYYNISHYERVKEILANSCPRRRYFNIEFIEEEVDPSQGVEVEFENYGFSLIEPDDSDYVYQNEIVDWALDGKSFHKIMEIQTGRGKTKIAMKAMVRVGKRVMLVTKASYLDKWTEDFTGEDGLNINEDQLIRIKSVKQLDKLLDKDLLLDPVQVFMISSHNLESWIKSYLEEGGKYLPSEVLGRLGVGFLLYDESHQLFLMNYRSFTMLAPSYVMDLSATLVPGKSEHFIASRYGERFPIDLRYNSLEYHRYIDAYSIYYRIKDRRFRGTVNKMRLYDHKDFEFKISRDREMLKAYFDMHVKILQVWYFDERTSDNHKALVFFSTKDMCRRFTAYLQKLKPDLNVALYIQGCDYKNFINADVGVTTPGKAGTAVDIKGLILTVCGVAISKQQTNLQLLGRNRPIRDGSGITPKSVFLHCDGIKKHVQYLQQRANSFHGKVLKFHWLNSKFEI